jgi:serine/threonine protein kinase
VRRSVMRDLARLLARLHAMNIYHRDLKTSNILIQGRAGEGYRVYLVDLDRVGERPRLSFSKKLNNLLQVRRRAWSAREQIYFFMRYAEGSYPSTKDRKALARKLFALSLKKDRLRPCRPRRMARRTDD